MEANIRRALPAISGWQLQEIPSGVWLSRGSAPVPARVLALPPEPQRCTVAVGAPGPGADMDQALSRLLGWLGVAGLASVRLLLSGGAARYGRAAARAYGLNIVAVEGQVLITPHGYVLARPADADHPVAPPQWRRFLPSGDVRPAGVLSPSPAWEGELAAGYPGRVTGAVAVHRVQAGLALIPPGADPARIAAAQAVWPDPARITVVAEGTGREEDLLLDAVTDLLAQLPDGVTRSVRLWWPRAGSDPHSPALHGMASRCAGEVIAPAADVSIADGCCGICHGPLGAAPWVRFTGTPPGQAMGPLYPTPGWELALSEVDLTGLPADLVAERIPAGLCVYRAGQGRPGQSAPGLAATARRVLPDPVRATVIADGTAGNEESRQAVEAVLGRLAPGARQSLRVVLSGAAGGGPDCYAQHLADALRGEMIAPTGGWTATPDGRLRAIRAESAAQPDGWRTFLPAAVAAASAGTVAGSVPADPDRPDRTAG
jgi:hypothetical protein